MGKATHAVGCKLIVMLGLMLVFVGVLIYGLVDLTVFWFIVGGMIGGFGLDLIGLDIVFIIVLIIFVFEIECGSAT